MSECPTVKQFLKMLPPGALYNLVTSPKPYYIRLGDGRVYVTSEAETAIINFDRHYAKQKVIMQKQSLENINVQIPHVFSSDADSQSEESTRTQGQLCEPSEVPQGTPRQTGTSCKIVYG